MKKFAFIAALLFAIADYLPAKVLKYNLVNLGTLPGYSNSTAYSINNAGQIVGEVFDDYHDKTQAVRFDVSGNGNNINLGTLGGNRNCAYSINDSNQIAGQADSNDWNTSPFAVLFEATGQADVLGLSQIGLAWSINKSEQIVGAHGDFDGQHITWYATFFDPAQNWNCVDLGTLPDYQFSEARSINNAGQIIGYAFTWWDYVEHRAVLFMRDGWPNVDLGTLGGRYSWAISNNDANQIVGAAEDSNGNEFAVRFDPNGIGNNFNLGTIEGFDTSFAASINNKGQIVGLVYNSFTMEYAAVVFSGTGSKNINLNNMIEQSAGFYLEQANCINDAGWIVGRGKNAAGEDRAFLLIPVECPEPLAGDLNGDCKVDFKDFAIMANEWDKFDVDLESFIAISDNWLTCNLIPESACRQ
jgi:uncharacterized membrane protein